MTLVAEELRVSILVINFNYERFVGRAIASALGQTYRNCQVVLFDDNSTDNSHYVYQEYADQLQIVESEHVGLVAALNKAFSYADGDLVMFLDADDYLDANCVETVVAEWRDGLSKIQFRLRTVDEYGVDQEMVFPYFPPDFDESAALEQSIKFGTYPWTVRSGNIYAREFLNIVLPIDTSLVFKAPDGYLNKLAPLYGGVKSLSDVCGSYRVHGRNFWAQGRGKFNLKPITDNVKNDVVMHDIFSRHAQAKGIVVGPFDDICVPNQVEIRLLSLRCGPSQHPILTDSLRYLGRLGIDAVERAPNLTRSGRMLWKVWFLAIQFGPRGLIKWAYPIMRGQSGRPLVFRSLVRTARGVAGTRPVVVKRAPPDYTRDSSETRVAVVIATLSRPEVVGQLLEQLRLQSHMPSAIVLSVETAEDLPTGLDSDVKVIMGPRGSCIQRNRGLELVLSDSDIVLFLDDDYLPSKTMIEGVAGLFTTDSSVVGATGFLIADGIKNGGIGHRLALELLDRYEREDRSRRESQRDLQGLYGCNMAVRSSAVGATRFDPNLPLYGWQEDVDFAAQLRPHGRLVKTNAFAGVHRGVTSGRTSGIRFGFSQMVNPIYLVRKGSMGRREAAVLIARNFIANHVRALFPESWIDRAGRLRGNWIGVKHLLSGRCDPAGVLDL